ncbi:MAG: GNAT family N-acetyltransferase [Alphaproteobacteria bacterium]|nr:GNAT family N-acetyltransferase [Alphaproteobacteria bacterium]
MGLFSKSKESAETLSSVIVRAATPADAPEIVRLAQSLSIADGGRPSRLTEESYRRDGFGETPAFSALVAEIDSRIVGYALYFSGYDTDRATRGVYLSDLYVDQAWRRRGVGRALMQGTARACKNLKGEWMFWSVLKRNKKARKFYKTMAPELSDVVLCAALGDSFRRLSE